MQIFTDFVKNLNFSTNCLEKVERINFRGKREINLRLFNVEDIFEG